MPFKKRASDGGFDFHVLLEQDSIILKPNEVRKFTTGVFCRFPEETVWQWDVRSSIGVKGISVTCKTVDCEYTGELHIVLINAGDTEFNIKNGERVAQLVPNPFSSKFFFSEVQSIESLGITSRGQTGFGGSNK